MGYANAVLLALFVSGFVLFAYGTTYRGPAADARVDVETIDEVPDGSNVVHYRDLPGPLQAAFDRALASESVASVAAASSAIDVEYVEYDGQYYRLSARSRGDGGALVELPLGAVGIVLSALSTVVYVLRRREARG